MYVQVDELMPLCVQIRR